MRTVKPVCLSVLPRCVEHRRSHYLCVSVLAMAPLGEAPMLFSEQSLWALLPQAAPEFTEAGVPKTRSEFLVFGAAYAPPGEPVAQATFGIRFAGIDKVGRAYGRRVFKGASLLAQAPLGRVPLDVARTYGGPGYALNPAGIGHPSARAEDGSLLLPELEGIDAPWHPDPDRNRPLVFGSLDQTHPDRMAGAGTYDDAWLKTDYPGLPPDADWSVFSVAPKDQRRPDGAPFAGDEAYELANLSPRAPRLRGRLPGLRVRTLIQRKSAVHALEELAMGLRTVVFLPDHDRVVMVWQGLCRVDSDDAAEIANVVAAAEYPDRPRPITHYAEVLRARTESEDSLTESLRDDQLLPPDLPFEGLLPADLDLNRPPAEDSLAARLRRRGERQLQAARDEVASRGLDPDEHAPAAKFPAVPPLPPLHQMGDYMRKVQQAALARIDEAKVQNAAMLDDLERQFAARGADFSVIRREISGIDASGPPAPLKDRHLETLAGIAELAKTQSFEIGEVNQMLADPVLHARWEATDRGLLDSYRANAHLMNPARPASGRFAERQQRDVAERLARGQGLRGLDLTGADLRGFDLHGVDCSGTLLEGARLDGIDLSGADFGDALLAHANLAGSRAANCRFSGANLGRANLEGIDASGANFAGANLWEARASRAAMREATFAETQFYGAILAGVDFTGAALRDAQFFRSDLGGACFALARIDEAQFVECVLGETVWRQCSGENVVFFHLGCPGGDFSGVRLPRARFVGRIALAGANFAAAALPQAYFAQESVLSGASFAAAKLPGIDLTGCELGEAGFRGADLRGASLRKARLVGADFSAANLMDACLMNADATAARFVAANLFAADLARIRFDARTRFDGALTRKARTYPRWQAPETAS